MEPIDITEPGPGIGARVSDIARRIELFALDGRVEDACSGGAGFGIAVAPDDHRAVAIRALVASAG